MVTTVGTENTFEKLVQNLLILEHDAIAAYELTIEKLEDPASKAKIAEFKADHESHVAELNRMAGSLGTSAPHEGNAKPMKPVTKIGWMRQPRRNAQSRLTDSRAGLSMRTP